MALAVKRIKVYGKFIVITAVLGAGLLVVLMNLTRKADVWFFHDYWLILVTAVTAIAGWWSFRKIVGVIRDLRELRNARQAERRQEQQQRLAREIAERERRLDEKLRRSITSDPDGSNQR
jgi:hypothetical protein